MDNILYQIFKIILIIFLKKHREIIDNTLVKIYVNKRENRIIIKIKARYCLELLTPETVILLEEMKIK